MSLDPILQSNRVSIEGKLLTVMTRTPVRVGMVGRRGGLPMERGERRGRIRGRTRPGVFWSINFMKHTESVSSGMFWRAIEL